jgi:hypothetical protein
MLPQDRRIDRVADLFWLLAHRGRGSARLGEESYALGLAASVLGELLTQPAALLGRDRLLFADPVLGPVMTDLVGAAGRDIVRPLRAWVEWLAAERHPLTDQAVVARLVAAGVVGYRRRHPVPLDQWAAAAPVTVLTAALGGSIAAGDELRLLAGLCVSCGLAGELAGPGDNRMVALQQLTRRLPGSLRDLLTALDDALHALAVRRG